MSDYSVQGLGGCSELWPRQGILVKVAAVVAWMVMRQLFAR